MLCSNNVNATITKTTWGCDCVDTLCSDLHYDGEWIAYCDCGAKFYYGYWAESKIYSGDSCTGSVLMSFYMPSDGKWMCGITGSGTTSPPTSTGGTGCNCSNYDRGSYYGSFKINGTISLYRRAGGGSSSGSCSRPDIIIRAYYGEDIYTISGNACGNGIISLLDTDDNILDQHNTTTNNYYSFNVLNNTSYKIDFIDHTYEFTVNGENIIYNNNLCNYIYGYTCNINWVKIWRADEGSWTYVDMESQPNHGLNTYVLQINSGYNYKVNFSDGHEHVFTCSGSDIEYDWDRCVWAYPPSPWQPPEIIPWYLGYDNNIVFMRDSHGNFIENAQIAVYNKNTGNYTQKWTNTPDPYILLAANNDSNDDVIVMCRTFDGVFTLETVDPAFGTDENVTWTNWTIPIMYNLEIHPIDQSNMPLHHVFVSMYEYTPFDPLAFFGYDTYWGCIPVTNCSGFSRCDIVAEKEGYRDYNVTGLNWTTKSALVKDYKQDIVLVRES